jgi:hypothetical protein
MADGDSGRDGDREHGSSCGNPLFPAHDHPDPSTVRSPTNSSPAGFCGS